MTSIQAKAGDFVIDAALLADTFRLSQDEIKARMRKGAITSRCEAGVDEDASEDHRCCQEGPSAAPKPGIRM